MDITIAGSVILTLREHFRDHPNATATIILQGLTPDVPTDEYPVTSMNDVEWVGSELIIYHGATKRHVLNMQRLVEVEIDVQGPVPLADRVLDAVQIVNRIHGARDQTTWEDNSRGFGITMGRLLDILSACRRESRGVFFLLSREQMAPLVKQLGWMVE